VVLSTATGWPDQERGGSGICALLPWSPGKREGVSGWGRSRATEGSSRGAGGT
jgi:hypothetical protein